MSSICKHTFTAAKPFISYYSDESDLKTGLSLTIPLLLRSIRSFDYSRLEAREYEQLHETIAQVMPKVYFLIKRSVADLVATHRLKAVTKEDDVLEKALTKFFPVETRKEVLATFVRRHLITGPADGERGSAASAGGDQGAGAGILERVRQKIFEDTWFKQFCGMRVSADTDIALKFLELSLEPQGG